MINDAMQERAPYLLLPGDLRFLPRVGVVKGSKSTFDERLVLPEIEIMKSRL